MFIQAGRGLIAAHAAGDDAKIQEISAEGQALTTQMQQLEAAATSSEEISAEIEAFSARVEGRMAELDPEAPTLIKRVEELSQTLQSMRPQGMPGGAPVGP